ncbi:MAG: hypothetical protein ACOCZ6_03900 [Nanoarchaeota archaeon]
MLIGKRGQAAMEFLMTYGWAILVVLAAVGILAYLGVFDMEDRVPSRCELNPTGQGIDCTTDPHFDVGEEDVTFTVINGNPSGVNVTGIDGDCDTLEDNDGNSVSAGNLTIDRGETKVLTANCGTDIGPGSNDLSFAIDYKDENGQPHTNRARISGVAGEETEE